MSECKIDGSAAAHGNGMCSDEAAIMAGPQGPGHHVMAQHDVASAIGYGDVDDSSDGGDAPSREDLVRQRELSRYRDDPDLTWRPHLVADDATAARLVRLARDAPNMSGAIEVARRSVILSRHVGLPLRLPPLLLVGPPGTGKSRFAERLAGALGTRATTLVGSNLQDTGPLTGYSTSWKGSGPGIIAKALLSSSTSSPMIVIDEAEKIVSWDRRSHPLDTLLSVLEPETAVRYKDNYYGVPMRADHAFFVLVANDLDGLSQPLLDRCVVVDVPALSGIERRRVMDDLAADIAIDYGIGPRPLDDACIALLESAGGLRRARAVVTAALAAAIGDGRPWMSVDDLRDAIPLLGRGSAQRQKPRRAGFIHFDRD